MGNLPFDDKTFDWAWSCDCVVPDPDLRWLRLMYAYPGHISQRLIAVMAGERTLPQLTEAEKAAFKVHKVAYDVALEAPPFRILGTVYLYPGSEPERLLDRSTELFVPVIDGVALHGDHPVGDPDVNVILVNRSCIRDARQVDRQAVEAARALLRPADRESLIGDMPDGD